MQKALLLKVLKVPWTYRASLRSTCICIKPIKPKAREYSAHNTHKAANNPNKANVETRCAFCYTRGYSAHKAAANKALETRDALETRCAFCYITFATPAELHTHATQHCFPHAPGEVLARFPVGVRVNIVDKKTGGELEVVGKACNPNMAHSCVSVRDESGLVADYPISRLERT
jgi:hypothetical protein